MTAMMELGKFEVDFHEQATLAAVALAACGDPTAGALGAFSPSESMGGRIRFLRTNSVRHREPLMRSPGWAPQKFALGRGYSKIDQHLRRASRCVREQS